jgi:hypothetical protein
MSQVANVVTPLEVDSLGAGAGKQHASSVK